MDIKNNPNSQKLLMVAGDGEGPKKLVLNYTHKTASNNPSKKEY